MFHSKEMGEIWHMGILAELTVNFHLKSIPIKSNTQNAILFGQIMKYRFFDNNWRSQCEIF